MKILKRLAWLIEIVLCVVIILAPYVVRFVTGEKPTISGVIVVALFAFISLMVTYEVSKYHNYIEGDDDGMF